MYYNYRDNRYLLLITVVHRCRDMKINTMSFSMVLINVLCSLSHSDGNNVDKNVIKKDNMLYNIYTKDSLMVRRDCEWMLDYISRNKLTINHTESVVDPENFEVSFRDKYNDKFNFDRYNTEQIEVVMNRIDELISDNYKDRLMEFMQIRAVCYRFELIYFSVAIGEYSVEMKKKITAIDGYLKKVETR